MVTFNQTEPALTWNSFFAARDRNDEDGMIAAVKLFREKRMAVNGKRVDVLIAELANWRYAKAVRNFE